MACLLIQQFFFKNDLYLNSSFFTFLIFSLINEWFFIMYIVIFEFMFDTFTFACPPDLFIRSSSVLSSWYLKHACPRWFRFSILFSRHEFDHDMIQHLVFFFLNLILNCSFFTFLFFSLINEWFFIMYVVIFEFMFDIFIFACLPGWFIHFSSVLFTRYLKHACPSCFRISLILSRHYFYHYY